MASPEFEKVKRFFKPGQADASDPTLLVREKMLAIHPTSCSEDTQVERLTLSGVPAAWIKVPKASADRTLFFVHGGAFVSTGITQYLQYGENVSRHFDARALVFEYRLAPEARYPAALEDTLSVYRAALEEGLDPARTAFVGDSCGGGIALAAMCALRDAGDPLPACYAGLTPWFDAEQQGESALHPRGLDPFVNGPWIRARFTDYLGEGGDPRDPAASPIHADLAGLPPLYLGAGEIDTTRDDCTRLAARAAAAGVTVTLEVEAGMIHGFHGLCGMFPEATAAMQRAGAFVRRHVP
jgi:acetyl esterase/lipase